MRFFSPGSAGFNFVAKCLSTQPHAPPHPLSLLVFFVRYVLFLMLAGLFFSCFLSFVSLSRPFSLLEVFPMCVSSYVPLKGACICVLASACVLSCLVLRVYSHVRACVCIYIYKCVCVLSVCLC